MSANSQPIAGQHKSAAPFGAVALLAGVVALGAIGIAYGQSLKVAPAAGVPPEVQAALIQHRADERASYDGVATDPRLLVNAEELADRAIATPPSLSQIMTESLIADRYGNASYLQKVATEGLLADRYGTTSSLNPGEIMSANLAKGLNGTGTGPQTGLQKGLVSPDRWIILAQDRFAQQQMSRTVQPEQTLRAHPARGPRARAR